jgi:hypothetical protein
MQEAKTSHATISPWQFHDETVAIDQNRNRFLKCSLTRTAMGLQQVKYSSHFIAFLSPFNFIASESFIAYEILHITCARPIKLSCIMCPGWHGFLPVGTDLSILRPGLVSPEPGKSRVLIGNLAFKVNI